jgi:hypothetical protein
MLTVLIVTLNISCPAGLAKKPSVRSLHNTEHTVSRTASPNVRNAVLAWHIRFWRLSIRYISSSPQASLKIPLKGLSS